MSRAARVRRQFRLGRPPKDTLPLHPRIAWDKAESLLSDLRQRMKDAGLSPADIDAQIIGVRDPNPNEPVFVPLKDKDEVVKILSEPDIIAIGMIFRQHDAEANDGKGQDITFPVQFTGLSKAGLDVLKGAANRQVSIGKKTAGPSN